MQNHQGKRPFEEFKTANIFRGGNTAPSVDVFLAKNQREEASIIFKSRRSKISSFRFETGELMSIKDVCTGSVVG